MCVVYIVPSVYEYISEIYPKFYRTHLKCEMEELISELDVNPTDDETVYTCDYHYLTFTIRLDEENSRLVVYSVKFKSFLVAIELEGKDYFLKLTTHFLTRLYERMYNRIEDKNNPSPFIARLLSSMEIKERPSIFNRNSGMLLSNGNDFIALIECEDSDDVIIAKTLYRNTQKIKKRNAKVAKRNDKGWAKKVIEDY